MMRVRCLLSVLTGFKWTPCSRSPSGVSTTSCSAPAGNGPAGATAWPGKMTSVCDQIMIASNAANATSAAMTSLTIAPPALLANGALCRERRLDDRRNPVDGERFLDHRCVLELGRRRLDMAAAGEHEWRAPVAQQGGNRPDALALQIDVEDGQVEPALFGLGQ